MPFLVGYVTPQDYGAVGDGVTDDTTALQNAVNAINTSGGGVLFVPEATYALSAAISVPNQVAIKGVGAGVSILKQTNTAANVLTYAQTNLTYIQVENLKILGPNSGSGVGISLSANAGANPVTNCAFRNLLIQDMGSHGLSVALPLSCVFDNVETLSNGGDGFHLTGAGTGCVFNNCFSNGDVANGFSLGTLSFSTLNSCAATSPGAVGYLLTTCNNVQLNACGCTTPTGNGFTISGGTGNTLLSCYVTGNNAVGAQFTGSTTSAFITGFREAAPTGSATASIKGDAGSQLIYGENTIATSAVLDNNGASTLTGGVFYLSGNGTSSANRANRAATTNTAAFQLSTAGTLQWTVGGMLGDSTNDLHIRDLVNTTDLLIGEQHATQANLQLLGTKSFGSGVGVVGLSNVTTAPSGNPSAGVITYASNGLATLQRDINGHVTSSLWSDEMFQMNALIARNMDPNFATSGNICVSGTINLHKIYVPTLATTTTVVLYVTTAGSSLTANQNFAALYDAGGTRRALTADQSASWNSTGVKTIAWASSFAFTTPGIYYVAIMSNGTTPATFTGSPGFSTLYNVNTTGATLVHADGPTAQTSMPASITMSSNTSSAKSIFVAIY